MGLVWAILDGVMMVVLSVDRKPALRPKDGKVLPTKSIYNLT